MTSAAEQQAIVDEVAVVMGAEPSWIDVQGEGYAYYVAYDGDRSSYALIRAEEPVEAYEIASGVSGREIALDSPGASISFVRRAARHASLQDEVEAIEDGIRDKGGDFFHPATLDRTLLGLEVRFNQDYQYNTYLADTGEEPLISIPAGTIGWVSEIPDWDYCAVAFELPDGSYSTDGDNFPWRVLDRV